MNPLAKLTTETTATIVDFPPPTWLKHSPIFMLPYAPFDGPYVGGTDAKYLSIGRAQWRDEMDPDALSAKVWRYPDAKWSRMSEELPLHRLADLCILLVKTFYQDHPTNDLSPVATIDAGTFEYQDEKMQLRMMIEVPNRFGNELIKKRLRKLREELISANLD